VSFVTIMSLKTLELEYLAAHAEIAFELAECLDKTHHFSLHDRFSMITVHLPLLWLLLEHGTCGSHYFSSSTIAANSEWS